MFCEDLIIDLVLQFVVLVNFGPLIIFGFNLHYYKNHILHRLFSTF